MLMKNLLICIYIEYINKISRKLIGEKSAREL